MKRSKKLRDFLRKGTVVPATLVASAVLGLIAFMSFLALPLSTDVVADMRLQPTSQTIAVGETFTVNIIVEATVPVNVFAGKLTFNNDTLSVESINYNTSIADLWAEEPWYSNGAGTLNFAGGTTQRGGFTGTGALLTITFKAITEGTGAFIISKAQILKHDGLGTDVELAKPIDALFTVQDTASSSEASTLLQKDILGTTYRVVETAPSRDLNGDGKQSIADASILLLNLGSQDMRYDLNLDGKVDLKDLNLVLTK